MMIDTDVLIWYLRGHAGARKAVDSVEVPSVSAVTYIELVQGMRNKLELHAMKNVFSSAGVRVHHINEDISARAIACVERFYLSHSLQLADALIGATALAISEELLTANARHYSVIPGLRVEVFEP